MWFSWRNLKISIAGAKLSHLVRKDKIWDHGTMIETVKIIFNQVQKERAGFDAENLHKYMTVSGYTAFKEQIQRLRVAGKAWPVKYPVIKEVAVIDVGSATSKQPDYFKAELNETELIMEDEWNDKKSNMIFLEQWFFVRQGDWWLLDEIKIGKGFLGN